jgi:hypothetical protein
MFTKLIKQLGFTAGCLVATIVFFGLCGISWIATCGLVYLITLCFDWTFSWGIATGVWLIIILLNGIFKKGSDK